MTIKLSEIIIKRLQPIFNSKYKHIIISSGRAGTKSSFGAIKASFTTIEKPSSVVVLRKRHNKLRKTVYKEILKAYKRLGVPNSALKVKVSPMEITYTPKGSTIYFTGNDNVDDTKGIIDENNPIKIVMIDEVTEFFESGEGEDELTNIEATFVRGNASGFQMMYFYNPPKNPNAEVNLWAQKMSLRDDCIHIHCDYRDVPVEWLGQDLIDSAEIMKATDEKMYNWVWLGLSTGIDEIIYSMFDDNNLFNPQPKEKYHTIAIGVDYGQQNATTFQAFALDMANKRFTGLDEYYYSGRETGRQKTPSDYAKDFVSFTKQLTKEHGCKIFYVFIDPSARGLQEEIKREALQQGVLLHFRNANNTVAKGIFRTQLLMTYNVLTFSDKQKELKKELLIYGYDPKALDKGKEIPMKEFDHCVTGDTIINTEKGNIPIKDLVNKTGKVWSYNLKTKSKELKSFYKVRKTRENAQVYKLTLENGKEIKCTEDHLILTTKGYKQLKYLSLSDKIIDISD